MTHQVQLVFAGDVVTEYFAAQTRAARVAEDGGDERAAA